MRLEVLCEDRVGLTGELLELLAVRNIDLRGIEIDVSGIIYLSCHTIEFDAFSELMTQIRHIPGVTDVRKIDFMPGERRNTELVALLESLPEPVLSVDLKGHIDMVNYAACELLDKNREELIGQPVSASLPGAGLFSRAEEETKHNREPIIINGLDYVLQMTPIYIRSDDQSETVFAGTVVTLKPVIQESVKHHLVPQADSLSFEHFVGVSNQHKALISQAKKFAVLDQPLLIQGETGTGKEMLARSCHAHSVRSAKPFLVLSCASMPDDVAETELFGHAPSQGSAHKGIFEQADGGTVFLDEIGEMSHHLQIKLLRFLQDGTYRRIGAEDEIHVDVRIIASTKHNLAELTERGEFRQDLYYRLNVLTLSIPALKERPGDIVPLLELFIRKHALQLGIHKPQITQQVSELLSAYPWPGNCRELDNTVLRAITRLSGDTFSVEDFQLPKVEAIISNHFDMNNADSLDEMMKQYESQILKRLYQSFPSSRKLAARLGVSHTSVANKLREYGINKS